MLVVAASGGGIRAGLWTAAVLAELERQVTGSSFDVRLITGASGGMVGAAYYAARMDDLRRCAQDPVARRNVLEGILDDLSKDNLGPVMRHWVFRDVPLLLWPAR